MQEQRPLNSDGTLRRERARTRGQTFRVSLGVRDCVELERAAAERKLAAEALLSAIGRVVVRDGLINAGLDDLPSDAVRSS